VISLLLVAVGLAAPAPASADAQPAPAPPRPLLLIGGTFVHQGYGNWGSILDWFASRGGYEPNANNQRAVWVGQMCRDTGDDPYDFARCGTTDPEEPEGWVEEDAIPWDDFVAALNGFGFSTAGLSEMDKSVEYVMTQINILRAATGASQIDVVAHSQGGTIARAAVRRLKEANPSLPSPVRRLVMLGAPQYGASPTAPLYDLIPHAFLPGFMTKCRDEGRLPMCPDMFLTGDGATVGAASETPLLNPLRYEGTNGAVIPFTHRAGFTFFSELNSSSGVGPTPSDVSFTHLYTRDYNGGSIEPRERLIIEQMRLFPNQPNVANVNYQDVCALEGVPNYPLHHNDEFTAPTSHALIALALGFPYDEPAACQ
jgi:hypothetical protein